SWSPAAQPRTGGARVPRGPASPAGRAGASPTPIALRLARVPPLLKRLGDLAEGRRIVDRCGQRVVLTVGDPLHRPAQDLPRARLRQALDDERGLEGGHGPDLLAHALDQLARDVGVAPLDPRLGDD